MTLNGSPQVNGGIGPLELIDLWNILYIVDLIYDTWKYNGKKEHCVEKIKKEERIYDVVRTKYLMRITIF